MYRNEDQNIIEKRRLDTLKEAKHLLNSKGKCAIIRPTGFGKTGILTELLKGYHNVLYLYPAEVVKDAVLRFYYGNEESIPENRCIPHVQFMTYAKLVLLSRQEMEDIGSIDLIITDECHKIGATETQRALDMLLEVFPTAHLLGATATPDRMDLVDEIGRYFEDNVVSAYTLHDAFRDGLLKRPYYIFCNYGKKEENESFIRQSTQDEIRSLNPSDRLRIAEDLNQRIIEISNLFNMEYVIRENCDKYAKSTDYMRFIVFFPDFESIHDKGNTVMNWFQVAYPEHIVESTAVTSETNDTRKNIEVLLSMDEVYGKIDLIFCCDMLNLGYHVDGLTGIMMYRGTKSGIVYAQQLGRILSSGSNYPGIVFDVVDNIHQSSIYNVLGHLSKYTANAKTRQRELEDKKTEYEQSQQEELREVTDGVLDNSTDVPEEKEAACWTKYDEQELSALHKRFSSAGFTIHSFSTLEPEDLIVVGRKATYRELIAKTVAEARSMRCRQAWSRWIEEGGQATDENGRVLTRREVLSQTPPENVPLPPFCFLKQVSVQAVLDEMKIPEEMEDMDEDH